VIIEPNTLAADVTRLEGTVQGFQRKLAIPLSELSRYYKLDLADCTSGTGTDNPGTGTVTL
jgi:hypothetical protein